MIKEENLKKIENNRYSPKEAFAYYIISFRNIENMENCKFGKILEELTYNLTNINGDKVLDEINGFGLNEIHNYWSLTLIQVLSYAFIVFSTLLSINEHFSEKEILLQFICVMRLYSPNDAEEYLDKVMKK